MTFDLEILRVDCVFSNCCLCIQNLIPVTLNFNSVKGTTCKIGDYARKTGHKLFFFNSFYLELPISLCKFSGTKKFSLTYQ